MRRLVMLLALALAAGACASDETGDDGPKDPGTPDDPAAQTFTEFVIDLVTNRTANDTQPVPLAQFESLPDPDRDNPSAYAPLFP